MGFKYLLVLTVAVLAINEAFANCGCRLTGSDVCGCSGSVVRPAPNRKINSSKPQKVCKLVGGVEPYQPIGDTCTCDSQIVIPAIQSQTPCTQLKIELDAPERCGEVFQAPVGFADYYYEPKQNKPAVPADPVSLTLAYGLAQKAAVAVPEERLQFGFRKKPEDGAFKKSYKNIPEERLFSVDREIVELQAPKSVLAVEDDFEEDDFEVADYAVPSAFLSYSDLGYGPVKPNNPQFMIQQQQAPARSKPSSAPLNFDCGFVPGKIVTREEVRFDKPKPCGYYQESAEDYQDSNEYVSYVKKQKKPCQYMW